MFKLTTSFMALHWLLWTLTVVWVASVNARNVTDIEKCSMAYEKAFMRCMRSMNEESGKAMADENQRMCCKLMEVKHCIDRKMVGKCKGGIMYETMDMYKRQVEEIPNACNHYDCY